MDRAKVLSAPERYAQMKNVYYVANQEKFAASGAAYYIANKAAIKLAQRRYYEKNRIAIIAYQRDYAIRNAVAIAAHRRASYFDNIEAVQAYRAENKLRIAASMAEWSRANPEARRENEGRRRARRRGNGIFALAPSDARRLSAARECVHCEAAFTSDNPKHIDHIFPIARGGRHSAGNLQPLCSRCNTSKHDQFYSVWRYREVTIHVKSRSARLHESTGNTAS